MRAPRLLLCCICAGVATSISAATLDDFAVPSAWSAGHSEDVQATLEFTEEGAERALRLNYDFGKVSGYAVATRSLPIAFPENYEISFRVRGSGSANDLQLKFVDDSGDNVWWYPRRNFAPTPEWQIVRIKKRHLDFAWGPTADRTLKRTARIELTVNAATGGHGFLEFERLSLTPLPPALDRPLTYTATATSRRSDAPANLAVDGNAKTAWVSGRKRTPETFTIDLGTAREFGGMEIEWLAGNHASRYVVQFSDDGRAWRSQRMVHSGNGGKDSLFLPESETRFARLSIEDGPGEHFGIAELRLLDVRIGTSANAFFRSIAQTASRGAYPRAIAGEQSYWTVIGIDGGLNETLIGEDGALEIRKGGFSVEPFIKVDDAIVTWADAKIDQTLLEGYLPIPSVTWRHPQFDLAVTAVADGTATHSRTLVTYQVTNKSDAARSITLALGVRPFQVNPPAQFLGEPGGVATISKIGWNGKEVAVDDLSALVAITPPDQFGAGQFDAGNIVEWLQTRIPDDREISDATGFASGVLLYRLELEARGSKSVTIALPLDGSLDLPDSQMQTVAQALMRSRNTWATTLDRVRFEVPPEGQPLIDTLRVAHSHILINRDGPALQPGSRAYARSWIRDGAMEADTLLRLGDMEPAKEFLSWYAPRLFENGKVPCCVDHRGSDPVPENDSAGEFIFLVADIYRYTRDTGLLREMWPSVQKALAYLETLRLQERTPAILASKQRAFYGLVPASISHEGYSAKPMHSYWDNFWTMKGYDAAVDIATALNELSAAQQYRHARNEFRGDLQRSLRQAMLDRNIRYLPGAAELGDFDATSTSIAVSPAGDSRLLPDSSLTVTFERYWSEFSARARSNTWEDYTPYELRNVATFAHLGWRDRAWSLLDFFMNHRRPAGWKQWAEVVGREARKERFIGDMPHAWVGSDYIRSVLDLFAYERSEDRSLVLMAGIPASWLQTGFAVEGLRTPYGALNYSVRPKGTALRLQIDAIDLPPGGLRVDWSGIPVKGVSIVTGQARWQTDQLHILKTPVVVELQR